MKFWLRFDADLFSEKGFFSWHRRPRKLSQWGISDFQADPESEIGLIIQGPIVYKHNFTLESARLYRAQYPNMPIFISTWAASKNFLSACNEIGVKVIENREISNPYYGNLNRQQTTTLAGLKALQSLGVKYAIKSRSDQRIYALNFVTYLRQMSRLFPPTSVPNRSSDIRIFITYQNSFLDRHLSGSDFLHFGETQDLIVFWKSIDSQNLPVDLAPEQILMGSYLLSCGWSSEGLLTNQTWIESMRKVVGFLDSSALDLFWLKYSSREYLWRRYGKEPMKEVTPADWYSSLLGDE